MPEPFRFSWATSELILLMMLSIRGSVEASVLR
jgi:hypothetical protein